jgi:hypothetical protein
MKEKLAKLIDVKSIITLLLCAVFCFLSIMRYIQTDQFMTVFSVIIAFYFGTQTEKKNKQTE